MHVLSRSFLHIIQFSLQSFVIISKLKVILQYEDLPKYHCLEKISFSSLQLVPQFVSSISVGY